MGTYNKFEEGEKISSTSKSGTAPMKNNLKPGKRLDVANAKVLTQTTMKINSGNKGGGRSA